MSVRNDVKEVEASARRLFNENLPVLVELAKTDGEISELTTRREQLLSQARQLFTEEWLAELGFGQAPASRRRARRPASPRGRSRSQRQGTAAAGSAAADPVPASDGEESTPPSAEAGTQADSNWTSSAASAQAPSWSG